MYKISDSQGGDFGQVVSRSDSAGAEQRQRRLHVTGQTESGAPPGCGKVPAIVIILIGRSGCFPAESVHDSRS